jgi:hypothetical protein
MFSGWYSAEARSQLAQNANSSNRHGIAAGQNFVLSRFLEETSEFDTQLYLDLQFVGETTAVELETRDRQNVVVAHFCEAVQRQVRCV